MGHLNGILARVGENLNNNFQKTQMPGGMPGGGGMLKLRFDRYITPSVTSLLRGENGSQQSDEFQAITRWGCSKNNGFSFYITILNILTIIIPLVRSYYILSKTWIRLLSLSHTIILPSLRFAVDLGNLNSPLSLPSLPNFVTNFPLSSNTCTL